MATIGKEEPLRFVKTATLEPELVALAVDVGVLAVLDSEVVGVLVVVVALAAVVASEEDLVVEAAAMVEPQAATVPGAAARPALRAEPPSRLIRSQTMPLQVVKGVQSFMSAT
jgi:hypothetical protein